MSEMVYCTPFNDDEVIAVAIPETASDSPLTPYGEMVLQAHRLRAELDALRAENKALRELLRELEWSVSDGPTVNYCPMCEGAYPKHGQVGGIECPLGSALGKEQT